MIRATRRSQVDWWLFAAVGGLMVVSPLVVWSATQNAAMSLVSKIPC